MGIVFSRGPKPSFCFNNSLCKVAVLLIAAFLLYSNLLIIGVKAFATPATPTPPTPTVESPESSESIIDNGHITTAAATEIPQQPEAPIVGRPAPECTVSTPFVAPATLDLSLFADSLNVIIDSPYKYYVTGKTLQDLRENIENCTARETVAGQYHASTSRMINWSYSFSYADGSCSLEKIKFGLHISQLLPAIAPGSYIPSETQEIWNNYETNLIVHENGHVDIARSHVNNLVAKLNSLGPVNCDTLKNHAEKVIDAALAELDAENTSYDIRTDHGATQGAVL